MADQSTCLSPLCGITIEGDARKCPQCGSTMKGSRNIRIRGWVLLGCGLFLVLFMGGITWRLLPTLLHPQIAYESGRFTGNQEQARMILALFGAVILFGALGTANGIYMISSGRQSRVFVIVTLLLAVTIVGVAWLMMRMLK